MRIRQSAEMAARSAAAAAAEVGEAADATENAANWFSHMCKWFVEHGLHGETHEFQVGPFTIPRFGLSIRIPFPDPKEEPKRE